MVLKESFRTHDHISGLAGCPLHDDMDVFSTRHARVSSHSSTGMGLFRTIAMPWRIKYVFTLCICLVISTYIITYWFVLREKATEINIRHGIDSRQTPVDLTANISRIKTKFQPEKGDVMVFFHMQKTGGTTLNSHLVSINVSSPCTCVTNPPEEGACRCRTSGTGHTWLFSRFTTSSSCGVHPPLSNLRACVPKFLSAADGYTDGQKHRFLYVTVLRDPIRRYLSEWKHLQKVPPWPTDCNHVANTMEACIKDLGHNPLTLKEFVRCPGNPANNRQVRMLSLDAKYQCQDHDDVTSEQSTIIERAKRELETLAFFGITDDLTETQELFEWTFGSQFRTIVTQDHNTEAEGVLSQGIDGDLLREIRSKNQLDIELFKFALQLFYNRYEISKLSPMS